MLSLLVLGFVRLARGEAGCEGGSWVGAVVVVVVVVVVVRGGVVSLVIVNFIFQLIKAEIVELTGYSAIAMCCSISPADSICRLEPSNASALDP